MAVERGNPKSVFGTSRETVRPREEVMGPQTLKFLRPEIIEEVPVADERKPWKVLVADDDRDVYATTALVLRDIEVEGRPLKLLPAFSTQQAKEVLASHPDIGLALVDVVMETPTAGLELIRYIREELGNRRIRIVIRTGQPGQAPEQRVIVDYDITDYREKTDLSAQKLFSLAYAALRSYQQIETIEKSREGLVKVVQATTQLFAEPSVRKFATGILEQVSSLVTEKDALYALQDRGSLALTIAGQTCGGAIEVVAASGGLAGIEGIEDDRIDRETKAALREFSGKAPGAYSRKLASGLLSGIVGHSGRSSLLFFPGLHLLDDLEANVVEVFAQQVLTAFENLYVHDATERAQREIVYRLGEAVESRSKETGKHVNRVALYARSLARRAGLPEGRAELLYHAAPLHDVGKIGVPDAILGKPGKLSAEEWEVMKRHTVIGHDMLKQSSLPILKLAATIALEHHERWDGSGYPYGKAGDSIAVESRIVGLVDVFDALTSERVYKKAWTVEQAIDQIRIERGRHFDPELADLFLANADEMVEIRRSNADDGETTI